MKFYLRELAHARAGDKGDTCNIGVIAYKKEFYNLILDQVTTDRVKNHFRSLVKGSIKRYELPKINAINLVMENALGGGVTRSLSLDPHGKSFSALLLAMSIDVDEVNSKILLEHGRTPLI